MGNLIVPPNWVNSTNFKMSSAASLRLVKTEPKTVFPTIFCFILGLLGIILEELGLSAIDLGPRNWECGYFLFLVLRKWSICVANGRCKSTWSCLFLSCLSFLCFSFREEGDVGYILEKNGQNQHRFQIKIHRII